MSTNGLGQNPNTLNPNPHGAQNPSGAGGSGGQQNPQQTKIDENKNIADHGTPDPSKPTGKHKAPRGENPPGQAVDPETGEPLSSQHGK